MVVRQHGRRVSRQCLPGFALTMALYWPELEIRRSCAHRHSAFAPTAWSGSLELRWSSAASTLESFDDVEGGRWHDHGPQVHSLITIWTFEAVSVEDALEQIPAKEMRRMMLKQLSGGKAHYKGEYLLQEMKSQRGKYTAGVEQIATADEAGMSISDPTAIRTLGNPDSHLCEVTTPLK